MKSCDNSEAAMCHRVLVSLPNWAGVCNKNYEIKCTTPRCIKLPTMCWTFSSVRHNLVDVSTFTSCVTLPHLGSVPLFVYPPC
jgi:hypothetical protein